MVSRNCGGAVTWHAARLPSRRRTGHDVKIVEYDSSKTVYSSDHEPVYCAYDFDAPPIPVSRSPHPHALIQCSPRCFRVHSRGVARGRPRQTPVLKHSNAIDS